MEQQGNYTKVDLLDLSASKSDESPVQIHRKNKWLDGTINVNEGHLGAKVPDKCNSGAVPMSNEELKIRAELEVDIERNLEEEIKDGICHLALRLHRLYQHQHQKERNARESSSGTKSPSGLKSTTFSEVNINIRMEGSSKIEINEIKKLNCEKGRPRTSNLDDKQGKMSPGTKKFDWARSLRSGTSPLVTNKKHEAAHARVLIRNDRNVYPNIKHDEKEERRNLTSAFGQRKGNVQVGNKKLLELGWKC